METEGKRNNKPKFSGGRAETYTLGNGGRKMSQDEKYDYILSHFKVARRVNDRAFCQCPSHRDDKPSLSISKGNKAVLVHCFAGCDSRDILNSVGLTYKDLYYNEV